MVLLLLRCCLCVCGIVLTKNACGTRPPPPLPYDDAAGPPRKGGLFLLNVVGVDLVSLRRTSWYFYLVLRLVHRSSLKFCQNNSLWLSEKMLAFSFNICLDLCSCIKALRTDKQIIRYINKHLPKHHNRLLSKFFKSTQVYFNPTSFTLSRVFNFLPNY